MFLTALIGSVVLFLGSAAFFGLAWNITELDALTGVDPSFVQWIGLSIVGILVPYLVATTVKGALEN